MRPKICTSHQAIKQKNGQKRRAVEETNAACLILVSLDKTLAQLLLDAVF